MKQILVLLLLILSLSLFAQQNTYEPPSIQDQPLILVPGTILNTTDAMKIPVTVWLNTEAKVDSVVIMLNDPALTEFLIPRIEAFHFIPAKENRLPLASSYSFTLYIQREKSKQEIAETLKKQLDYILSWQQKVADRRIQKVEQYPFGYSNQLYLISGVPEERLIETGSLYWRPLFLRAEGYQQMLSYWQDTTNSSNYPSSSFDIVYNNSYHYKELPTFTTAEAGTGGNNQSFVSLSLDKRALIGLDALYSKFNVYSQGGDLNHNKATKTVSDISFEYQWKSHIWDIRMVTAKSLVPAYMLNETLQDRIINDNPTLKSNTIDLSWLFKGWKAAYRSTNEALSFSSIDKSHAGLNQFGLSKRLSTAIGSLLFSYDNINQFGYPHSSALLNPFGSSHHLATIALDSLQIGPALLKATGITDENNHYAISLSKNTTLYHFTPISKISLISELTLQDQEENTSLIEPVSLYSQYMIRGGLQTDLINHSSNMSLQSKILYGLTKRMIHMESPSMLPSDDLTQGLATQLKLSTRVPLQGNYTGAAVLAKTTWDLQAVLDRECELINPVVQSRCTAEIGLQLRYDNVVRIGASWLHVTPYLEASTSLTRIKKTDLVDAFATIELTKRFEVQLWFKNINNSYEIFGQDWCPPTILTNIRWDFIN